MTRRNLTGRESTNFEWYDELNTASGRDPNSHHRHPQGALQSAFAHGVFLFLLISGGIFLEY
jgi:hypothetical protein